MVVEVIQALFLASPRGVFVRPGMMEPEPPAEHGVLTPGPPGRPPWKRSRCEHRRPYVWEASAETTGMTTLIFFFFLAAQLTGP